MKKQYVGLVRDHSGSMASIVRAALNDYNQVIGAIKNAADKDHMGLGNNRDYKTRAAISRLAGRNGGSGK